MPFEILDLNFIVADFQFLKNPVFHNWVILAPRRAKRPDVGNGTEPVCPFCPGREGDEQEVYRVSKSEYQSTKLETNPNDQNTKSKKNSNLENSNLKNSGDWLVRVLPNRFPFAPIHEVIIHSPDHHANFGELPVSQVELILQTYRNRYKAHQKKGEVYIFHNRGEAAGESLPHPHTQLAVVPFDVKMDIPRLDPFASPGFAPVPQTVSEMKSRGARSGFARQKRETQSPMVETEHFYLFCPKTSQWPDEVWVAPKNRGRAFGEITDDEINDLAGTLNQLIRIFDLRHVHEFPYNFYIYPGGDWYLRLIPRQKRLGGFEVGTGIFVNTQDPEETLFFIKEHFAHPDEEKIRTQHQAEYHKSV